MFIMQRKLKGETPAGRPGGPPGQPDMLLKRELNLTEQQLAQVRTIRQAHREEQQALHRELRRNRDVLIQRMTSDPEAAKLLADSIGKIEVNLAHNLIQHYAALEAICTAEQAEKLARVFTKALGPPPRRPGGPPPRRER